MKPRAYKRGTRGHLGSNAIRESATRFGIVYNRGLNFNEFCYIIHSYIFRNLPHKDLREL